MNDLLANMQAQIGKSKESGEKKKETPHEKAAIVNEIIALVGESKKYNYGYWLRMIGAISFSEMQGILKQVQGADAKYNKGGMLTNILRKRKLSSPQVKVRENA